VRSSSTLVSATGSTGGIARAGSISRVVAGACGVARAVARAGGTSRVVTGACGVGRAVTGALNTLVASAIRLTRLGVARVSSSLSRSGVSSSGIVVLAGKGILDVLDDASHLDCVGI
jgi:hypothetical protein